MKRLSPILFLFLSVTGLYSQSRDQLFDQGLGAFQDRLYEDALENFTAYLDRYSDETRADAALYMSGVSLFNLKRYPAALDSFARLEEEQPRSPYLRRTAYWQGRSCYSLEDWDCAEEAFSSQLAFEDENYYVERSLLYLGVLAENREDWTAASDHYGALVRQSANTELVTQAHYRRGLALIRLNDYQLALHDFEKLSSDFGSNPYSKAVPYYIGLCYFELGRYEEARRRYDLYLKLFPGGEYREAVLFQLAQAESAAGNSDRAGELLEELQKDFPGGAYSLKARNLTAENYSLRGKTGEARVIWQDLLAGEQDRNEADRLRHNIGLSLRAEGDNRGAADMFRACLDNLDSPVRAACLDMLGRIHLEEDEKGRALEYLKTLFDDYPDYPDREAAGALAASLMIEQDRDDILEGHLRQMVELYGSGEMNHVYLMMLGQAAMDREEWTRALSYLGRLERDYPESEHRPDALYRLGYIYVLRNEYIRGAGYFEELLEIGTDLSEIVEEDARFSLALCHYRAGNTGEARGYFKDYLGRYGQSERGSEIALYMGDLSFADREWSVAENYYSQAGEAFRASGDDRLDEALFKQALALQKMRRWEEAGDLFYTFWEKGSSYGGEALYQTGLCREQSGDRDQAVQLFLTASDRRSSVDDEVRERSLYQLARLALLEGERENALEKINTMKADYPDSDLGANLLFSQAEDYWVMGEFGKAREWYLLLKDIYPGKPQASQAVLRASLALVELGETDKAREELFVLTKEEKIYAAALSLGELLREQNDPETSLRMLTGLTDASGDRALLAPLILAAVRTGANVEEKTDLLENLYKDESLAAMVRIEALLLLAGIRGEEGLTDDAESYYRVVMDSDRGELGAEANYLLGELLARDDPARGGQEFLNLSYNYPAWDEWAAMALYRAWEIYSVLDGEERKADIVRDKLLETYPDSEWSVKIK